MARKKKVEPIKEVEVATAASPPIEVKPVVKVPKVVIPVQQYLATTNINNGETRYLKHESYPEDEFILQQNAEDLFNGYPNRFFRKL